jgi:hypothetical protein
VTVTDAASCIFDKATISNTGIPVISSVIG